MTLVTLNNEIANCQQCPRLRAYGRLVAIEKRHAYRDQTYWGKPVPNFIPAIRANQSQILIIGLAPGAHGAHRTGRMFTGDRSGDFLFHAMHAVGLASQPTSLSAADGLNLIDCVITAACHCAPPGNKPMPVEIEQCQPFLDQTARTLKNLKVVLALGRIAHDSARGLFHRMGWGLIKSAKFADGAVYPSQAGIYLVDSYHPSQQNTFTGKLTQAMLQTTLGRSKAIASNNPIPISPRPAPTIAAND